MRSWLLCLWLSTAVVMANEKTVVVVWPFEDITFLPVQGTAPQDIGDLSMELLISALLRNPAIDVVERQQLDKVLEELNLSCSGLADKDACLKVGRIVGARKMVFGSYFLVDGQVNFLVRRVDVGTSEIEKTVDRTSRQDRLPEVMDEIATEIIE